MGSWYFAVGSVTSEESLSKVMAAKDCSGKVLKPEDLSENFGSSTSYEMQTFTSGCYYFNSRLNEWRSDGTTVNSVFLVLYFLNFIVDL